PTSNRNASLLALPSRYLSPGGDSNWGVRCFFLLGEPLQLPESFISASPGARGQKQPQSPSPHSEVPSMLRPIKSFLLVCLLLAVALASAKAAEREDVRKAINLVTSVKMPF